MASKPSYYTVTESLVGTLDGVTVEYHKGEVVDADDPAVRKWPVHFGPLVVREHRRTAIEQATAAPEVEQATAAPGEQRHVGRPITTGRFKGRE